MNPAGVFGHGFNDDLEMGGPVPNGARQANLSAQMLPFLEEIALNEQGHALFTRQAGSTQPCPTIDFTGGYAYLPFPCPLQLFLSAAPQ